MSIEINGLLLPIALEAAIRRGVWRTPDSSQLDRLFPDEKAPHANFYNLRLMMAENASWLAESSPSYLGRASSDKSGGDIDPSRSVLIADLGPDKLIALDYRRSASAPAVVYLRHERDGSRWIAVSPDVDSFMECVGIRVDDTSSTTPER